MKLHAAKINKTPRQAGENVFLTRLTGKQKSKVSLFY
jgi:hypothetical protein